MEQLCWVKCNDIHELKSMLKFGIAGLPYVMDWAVSNLEKRKEFPIYVDVGVHDSLILLGEISETKPLFCYYYGIKILTFKKFIQHIGERR